MMTDENLRDIKKGENMLNAGLKQEILKSIDITRQSAKNNLDITLESYMEIIGRLDLLTYLLINQDKK